MGNLKELQVAMDKVNEKKVELVKAESYLNSIIMNRFVVAEGNKTATVENAPAPEVESQLPETNTKTPMPDVVETPTTEVNEFDTDASGVPYNEEIHASKKGKTGGKDKDGNWKMVRGGDRDKFNAWAEQHKGKPSTDLPDLSADTPVPAPTADLPPPVADTPTADLPPPVAGADLPPPVADTQADAKSVKFNEDKALAIAKYQVLTQEFGIHHGDLVDEVGKVFDVPTTDEQIQFGSLTYEQTDQLAQLWTKRVDDLTTIQNMIARMYKWAGADYQANIDSAVKPIFAKYDCEEIGELTPEQVEPFLADIKANYDVWFDWATKSKRV